MAKKYLDYDGLLYFWQSIKSLFVSDVTYDSSTNYIQKTKGSQTTNVVQLPSGVSPSTTTPKMDGTAATGTETAFARGDHVHPTDTSRAASSHTHGHISNNGSMPYLVSNSTTIDNNDRFLIIDYDDTGKIKLPSIKFDGSTTTKALTPKGTWQDISSSFSVVDGYLYYNGFGGGYQQGIIEATTSNNGLMSSADKTKLDSISMTNGVIDSSCLPSFVDDVIEAYARSNQTELGSTWLATGSASGTVITPEAGKIYVLMNDSTSYSANSQFRWGGTAYVKLADGGVTSITNAEIDTILAS